MFPLNNFNFVWLASTAVLGISYLRSIFLDFLGATKSNIRLVVAVSLGYFSMIGGFILVGRGHYIEFGIWELGSLRFGFGIYIDYVRLRFVGVILVIGGRVLVYIKWYIIGDPYARRFVGLIYLFLLSMVFIICFPNMVFLLIGWDGLGLTSYLLVCYYQNVKGLSAGMLTAMSNRIGDVFILLRVGLLAKSGSWPLYNVSSSSHFYSLGCLGLLVCIASCTKRAQIPFCAWLPAAIAAPTPVSSLVHSSTLVTAGVYLLMRSYPCYSENAQLLSGLIYVALFTLALAGSSAVVSVDIKKVVALSTLSQLSLIIFCISAGIISVAFFHLVAHALIKSLLFITVGALIHFIVGIQDVRSLGGCWSKLPYRSNFLMLAQVSLCGRPYMRGFFSKDMVAILGNRRVSGLGRYLLIFVGLSFTRLYRLRLAWCGLYSANYGRAMGSVSRKSEFSIWLQEVFTKQSTRGSLGSQKSFSPHSEVFYPSFGGLITWRRRAKDSERYELLTPYFFIGVGALFFGFLAKSGSSTLFNYENVSWLEIATIISMRVIGLAFIIRYDIRFINISSLFNGVRGILPILGWLSRMWFIELLSSQPTRKGFLVLGRLVEEKLDKGWLEVLGGQGAYRLFGIGGKNVGACQSFYFLYRMGAAFGLLRSIIIVTRIVM